MQLTKSEARNHDECVVHNEKAKDILKMIRVMMVMMMKKGMHGIHETRTTRTEILTTITLTIIMNMDNDDWSYLIIDNVRSAVAKPRTEL